MSKIKRKIHPLFDRVLVKTLSKDEKTASGIIIPDTIDKETPQQGEIVAVGEGRFDRRGKRIPLSVRVGDNVYFSKYGYDEITIDDKDYLIIKEDNILAIIK